MTDVSVPAIGSDFLGNFELLVDSRHHQLRNGNQSPPIRGILTESASMAPVIDKNRGEPRISLLAEFRKLARITYNKVDFKHFIQHYIITNGPSTNARPRRLDPRKLKIARQGFDKLMGSDILRFSSRPWATLLHMAPKKSVEVVPFREYWASNGQTTSVRYPIPHIHDFTDNMEDDAVFEDWPS